MDNEKLINIGKALVSMLEQLKDPSKNKGTTLEQNIAFFEWEEKVYRMHLSNIEDPWIYSLANKEGKVLDFVNDDDDFEDIELETNNNKGDSNGQ